MRIVLFALGVFAAVMAIAARADAAPAYRYCAQYEDRGDVTCAYDTFQQCLDTAGGGAGGFCSENPVWHPTPTAAPRSKTRRNKP